ncbi:TetR/AcrR family transcriptional regulator [Pseudooceanicola sp. CBS1P-1]|uniref:TetR family transcriptional regulator n=1 Tax=Pseudooceanicola albus TaxID=2692189 RepID=A0A6L7GAT7_9RHOB|nr:MULTISPECIES: TetR/AcrR family transcriptional regulator [Pseudooceanicola]MBT9386336.1 TetR/AcrR family transcriptional regulator [Pseudooceanicola endophyticus]MXN21175.1 TetR family transcriptional regulator [Pseudooceanicola albus]
MSEQVNAERRRPGRKALKSEKDWLEAALVLLADGGIEAVRVEPLAQSLGVTKGSFYKRYDSRDDLLVSMLDYWRRESTLKVIELLSGIEEPSEAKLARVLEISGRRPDAGERARMEMAIRLWGHSDRRAAATMEEVDALRLKYFRSVVLENGFDGAEAEARAFLIYALGVLEAVIPGERSPEMMEACRAIVAGKA